MAFERLRQWGQTKVPLASPEVVEIGLGDLLAGLTQPAVVSEVELPIVGAPTVSADQLEPLTATVSDDFALHESAICTEDLSLAGATPRTAYVTIAELPTPDQRELSGFPIWSFPPILDLFTSLVAPGRAGKAYGSDETALTNQPASSAMRPARDSTGQLPLWQDRCKHGLLRNSCELCAEEDERFRRYATQAPAARPKLRTIDVFDLLLPYLQPPLEPLLAEPLLFPPDRRPDPYQVQGVRFLLAHPSALLGDVPGLGKTAQAIIGLQGLFRQGSIHRSLILCPRSLLKQWEKELRHWAPEFFVLRIRGGREDREVLWESPANVFLTTYETLRQDIEQGVDLAHRFDAVILDEAQKIKNPAAGLTQAVCRLQPAHRWGLSGTPLENRTDDVVSIFSFLNPELFRRTSPPYDEKMVRDRITPHFLRRRGADVLELPEKKLDEIWLDLNDEQRESYDRAYQEGRAALSQPGTSRIHVFSLLDQLKQICNLDPKTKSSSKLDYLEVQLEAIVANDQKALVFSQFPNKTLREIAPRLSSFGVCVFDGSLNDTIRERILTQFEQTDYPRVLLMSVKAGGLGLNLVRANHVFHFDHWWNPAVARQAEARAHRRKQTQTVFVYDLFISDTIEERIHNLLAEKQGLFDAVIDDLSTQDIQKGLTDEDLFGLFDLKPPAGASAAQLTAATPAALPPPKARLHILSPSEFEQLVARLYNKMGFVSQATPMSRDGGVDVVARRQTDVGSEHLIIQCKHSPEGVIGEPIIRELVGTWQAHREATRAVLVTSGRFSSGALELAKNHRIDLIDGLYLVGLLRRYQVE